MFNGSSEKEFSEKNFETKEDVERVYVDWPEIDSEEFRFISSRLEDGDREMTPLYLQHHMQDNEYKIFDINQLRFGDKSTSGPVANDRYEDLSKKKISKKKKNSSVPPLDLISQNSSIEIPGAKGVIDIDLRSSSESLSDDSEEYKNQSLQNFERDSLDVEKINHFNENERNQNYPLLSTTLPEIQHSDLMLNPGEYDTSRYNLPTSHVSRKFSEISVASQYKSGYSGTDTHHAQRLESEKAIFEAAKQKYKQNVTKISHKSAESHQPESVSGPSPTKIPNSKPTMLVAPQIKQQLYNTDKTPNFVELNKMYTCPQKQSNQTYASKFIDRHHKESPKPVLKKSESFKDSIHSQNMQGEKINSEFHHEFFSEEYLNKRVKSVDRFLRDNRNGDNHELPIINSGFTANRTSDSSKSVNPPHIIYAYNQYGEPIIINTEKVISQYHNTNIDHSHFYSPYPPNPLQYYPSPNIINDSRSQSNSPQINHKVYENQEINRTTESEFVFKDANYKRQPTLYDESLLTKKFKEITTERSGSRFPPIPNTNDSAQTQTTGYASHHKKKEISYEQYTLRDFKNIKQVERGSGLGPNIGSDSYKQLKEKLIRQKNYSKAVLEKNRQELIKTNEKTSREKPIKSNTSENMSFQNVQDVYVATRDNDKLEAEVQKPVGETSNEHVNSQHNESKPSNIQNIGSASSKEQTNKRDAMLNYAKSVQEKQIKKKEIKPQGSKVHSANIKKEVERSAIHELIHNSDLDRLLQRHEDDKKIADQIRIKLGKIS